MAMPDHYDAGLKTGKDRKIGFGSCSPKKEKAICHFTLRDNMVKVDDSAGRDFHVLSWKKHDG